MKLNSKEFIAAAALIREPQTKLEEYRVVRFEKNKLTRITLSAYIEVDLEGAEEGLAVDSEWLAKVDPQGETMEITSDGSAYTFRSKGMLLKRQAILGASKAFPEPIGEGVKIIVPQNSFKTCLAAASTDRPAISGVILDGDGENLLLCGTNGQQLHAVWAGATKLNERVLIETSLARMVQSDFVLTIHSNLIIAQNSNSRFLLHRIADKTPEIRSYVQTEFDEFCTVEAEPVLQAVKSLKNFHPNCYILMDFGPESLTLSVFGGTGEESFTVPCNSKKEFQVKILESRLLGSLPLAGSTITFSSLKSTMGLAIKNKETTILLYGARLQNTP